MCIKDKKIGIFGLWHLGTVLCAAWSEIEFMVVGFDYDKERVKQIQKGIPPVFEPNLTKTLKKSVNRNFLRFSSDIASLSECDFIFLSYDTPVTDDDASDTTILKKSVMDVSEVMKDKSVLIVSSQSPIGYCSILRNKLKKVNSTLELAYSPENLRLGEAIHCYLNPGRIILGTANRDTATKCITLFNSITNDVLTMNLESAEMVKHGINSFLAMSIVFANNLADICEEKKADIIDAVRGIKSDPRIGQKAYLSPGIGFSGGTLGRDLKVLEMVNGNMEGSAELFGIIHKLNRDRKNSIVNKIKKMLKNLENKSIGILGLTYKPGTSTLRRSLPLEIVNLLIQKGAVVKVYDPKADYSEININPKFIISDSVKDLSRDLDILVLLTEWPEFKEYNWGTIIGEMTNNLFFDTKNFLDEDKLKAIGFLYHSIGR